MHGFELTDSMCEQTGTGSSVVNTGLSLARVDLSEWWKGAGAKPSRMTRSHRWSMGHREGGGMMNHADPAAVLLFVHHMNECVNQKGLGSCTATNLPSSFGPYCMVTHHAVSSPTMHD